MHVSDDSVIRDMIMKMRDLRICFSCGHVSAVCFSQCLFFSIREIVHVRKKGQVMVFSS
jgi:hypothetical protein